MGGCPSQFVLPWIRDGLVAAGAPCYASLVKGARQEAGPLPPPLPGKRQEVCVCVCVCVCVMPGKRREGAAHAGHKGTVHAVAGEVRGLLD